MMTYEKELQEALMKVLCEHKPITLFDFGVQIGYMHAIARANVTGRCDDLEDVLAEQTQVYKYLCQKEQSNRG